MIIAPLQTRSEEETGSAQRTTAQVVDAFHYERTLFDADRETGGTCAPTFRPVRS